MQAKKCHACDRVSHSLFTANCGHKTCFYCYKNNKPVHKCKKCNQKQSHSLSPIKSKSNQKTTHLQSQQTKHGGSYSAAIDTDRLPIGSHKTNRQGKQIGQVLMCLEHKQPLNMFCKSSKQILCSMCLCKKNKFAHEILPLRNAEQYLRKQNKMFREQARLAQIDVDNAWRIVNRNRQIFEQEIESHTLIINQFYNHLMQNLKEMQQNSIKLCRNYLTSKINEYGQISDDLHYISETLKQYRQSSLDNGNINQLAYYYTSFNVIKKTLESLSFDYVPYEKKQIMLIDFDKILTQRVERELIKFRFNLQIKTKDKNNSRSNSIRSAQNRYKISPDVVSNKHKIADNLPNSKKHKFSLCSNGSVEYDQDDTNLYKRLLKTKYKL